MADWATISGLATAGGTLALAGATFAAVRSANRAARATERSLLAGLRPLLLPSRPDDPEQKVGFIDERWLHVAGAGAAAEATDDAVYLVLSLRNAGAGVAVLHGWRCYPERRTDGDHPTPEDFTRLTRDLYIPPNDVGFWQGALRDPAEPAFADVRAAIETRSPLTVDILYGDHEGGQRTISRYVMLPRERDGWFATGARHWNVDRADPR